MGAFYVVWRDLNRAGVNEAPVGPQSREQPLPAGKVESLLLRQKKVRNFGLFSCFGALSTQTSTQTASERLNEALHLFGAVPHHRGRYMCILIHRESGGGMPHVVGNGFYVDPVLQRQRGIGVPLGYNNDKTGNPYGTRVLSDSGC